MVIPVVKIGNSRGVRLPKAVIEQLNISDKIDLEIEDQCIILKPIKNNPRQGWSDAFKRMHELNEDALLDQEGLNARGFEWEW